MLPRPGLRIYSPTLCRKADARLINTRDRIFIDLVSPKTEQASDKVLEKQFRTKT